MSSDSSAAPQQYAAPAAPTPEELAALPHDNGAPKLNAVVWVLTGLSGAFLALRIYCKFSRRKGLWWDDYLLIAAWVLHISSRPSSGWRLVLIRLCRSVSLSNVACCPS